MSERLLAATRKGLFSWRRGSSGWEIDRVDFLGHPVNIALRDPRDGWTYAALALGHFGAKLHRSADGGVTWEETSVPMYPEGAVVATNPFFGDGQPVPATLNEIWALEPGGKDEPGTLWAGTIPGGLFRSRDRGTTWELIEGLWNRPERMQWMGGGKDLAGIHSICVDPRDSRRVQVGISSGGVWRTEDGGASWSNVGQGLRNDYLPPEQEYDPNAQDVHRLAQCPADPDRMWVQHHNGIFRSVDGATTFEELKDVQPSVFGFAVCAHPHEADTAWFAPADKDERRYAKDAKVVVTRTRDGGRTFETLSRGLPDRHAYDLVFRHGLDVDETGNRLAMGSSTGSLWISENGGDSWTDLGSHFPQIYCVRFA